MSSKLKRAYKKSQENTDKIRNNVKKALVDAHFQVIFRDIRKREVIETVANGLREECFVEMSGLAKKYRVDKAEAKRLVARYKDIIIQRDTNEETHEDHQEEVQLDSQERHDASRERVQDERVESAKTSA